ncbi:MAG: hypothetical protein MPW16_02205 [Candidatus Manganitrophus sp.]|nr:MAG: hypothetical protein MPW16_02205 [Candidatus Manganitrophus sp.]
MPDRTGSLRTAAFLRPILFLSATLLLLAAGIGRGQPLSPPKRPPSGPAGRSARW